MHEAINHWNVAKQCLMNMAKFAEGQTKLEGDEWTSSFDSGDSTGEIETEVLLSSSAGCEGF